MGWEREGPVVYRVMMVCTGNICRSPMAEVVLQQEAAEAGVDVEVESSAISGWEVGNPIDSRAARVLRQAGYDVPDRGAQKLSRSHMEDFDLVLAMTDEHKRVIDRLAKRLPENRRPEVRLYREFASDAKLRSPSEMNVPDPWYGTQDDFYLTLNTLQDATPNLLDHIKAQA